MVIPQTRMQCQFAFVFVLVTMTVITTASWDLSEVLQKKSSNDAYNGDGLCSYSSDASLAVKHLLCSIESNMWHIPVTSRALTEAPCLIGSDIKIDGLNNVEGIRCNRVRKVPIENELPISPPPPDSKNPSYKKYAEKQSSSYI